MSVDLSPCSSCETFAPSVLSYAPQHSAQAQPLLTILLPNLIDRCSINPESVRDFVKSNSDADVDPTVNHLLLYLFHTSTDPAVTSVTHIKLLHRGQPYCIRRVGDLQLHSPLLKSVVQNAPTFQLVVAPDTACPPISTPLEHLLQRANHALPSTDDCATTYAEAMIKFIKRSRKSSVSSQSTATRSLSRDSTTDVEDSGAKRATAKFKKTVKRAFQRTNQFLMDAPMH